LTREIDMTTIDQSLRDRSNKLAEQGNILGKTTVYLSGPMDFVADRNQEAKTGWRTRISQFLRARGVKVYDPEHKPDVVGMPHYGKEDEFSDQLRADFTYDDTPAGRIKRAQISEKYWPTVHTDLRMTDLANFIIAYCPTNTYSVGTVHEIAMARQEHKPVLLVTPRLKMGKADELEQHLQGDKKGLQLLEQLRAEAIIKPNPGGKPSIWYMGMVKSEDYFFDGFGFAHYMNEMGWKRNELLDAREEDLPPQRPLLPYLDQLNSAIPKSYNAAGAEVENADWLIFPAAGSD
jgi:hypothetical protein